MPAPLAMECADEFVEETINTTFLGMKNDDDDNDTHTLESANVKVQ